MNNPQN
jgi:hypothetical protein